ncbi:MAG: TonB-dependent receptor [Haliscomenobacter sp.]|uniref:SusC/RagA family TonB-linked outer membrane protein n=1 Tax=Haliscomenobacter sp. TaxID=2717303 RepID=UPI0029BDA9F0|nr:TonB-dependent receptor [Haliscomenobacter sp.]MDX2071491.1 TonB-dependent receptor [Haliscomenobacter sp.]
MKNSYSALLQRLAVFLLLCLPAIAVMGQRTISGKVTDTNREGLPGVNVLLKGTATGVVTELDGTFSMEVPSTGGALVVSYVGYRTLEVALDAQSAYNITLEEDVSTLKELVVTGYTIDSRREATGAVSTVKAKDLVLVPSGNVEQQLAGRVSGVTVVTNGQPGTTSQIRVRGFGSFGGNEPLYIVDGVPVGSTDFLNPGDIESTTVLKDAAAASIYGARAANGVIVYTTKKGSKSARKLTVTYDGLYGFTDPGNGQPMMNPTDFAFWTAKGNENSGIKTTHPQFGTIGLGGGAPVIPDYLTVGAQSGVVGSVNLEAEKAKYNVDTKRGSVYQVVKANKAGTDWYDEITRVAPITRHSLGFSGGGENSRFYFGLSTQNQSGIMLYNEFKRHTFRSNSEFNLTKRFRIGENIQFTYRQVLGQTGDNGGLGVGDDENDVLQAFRMPSIIPVYDEFGGWAGTAAKGFNNPRNPVANRERGKDNRNFNAGLFGNIYAEYDLIDGLTWRTSLGGNYGSFYNTSYFGIQYENSENNSAFTYGEGGGFNFGWVVTNTANYKKKFGIHGIDVLVGQEALNTGRFRNISGSGLDPFSNDPDFITLPNTSRQPVNSNYGKGVNFASYFGRVAYNMNDKYIVTALVRRDGSSRFGENNRYGVFPAFSAAWRISSEKFMENLKWIDDLKIRGGYGIMGNSNQVDPNNQFSLYGGSIGASSYDVSGTNSSAVLGFYRTRIGNPDAKWETSVTQNIGFDGTFFNGKLDVILDIWKKNTRDLLLQVPIAATNGVDASAPSVNIAEMFNGGVDIQVITRGNLVGDLKYELNVTAGTLKNEISSLAPGLTYLTTVNPGYRGLFPIRNQLGYSISSFYGYEVTGLFQTAEEVANSPAQDGRGVGRFRYADLNGDNKIDVNDRTYLGSPVPKFSGGIGLTLTYKNIDFTAYANGVFGNKIFNASKWFTDFFPSFQGAAISERVKDSWSPSNRGATIPIFETASNFSTNTQSNSFYVEDGSYVRLQNLGLGYTLPASTLAKLKISRLRVFASANNLLTITKYEGLDPSVGGNADTQFGIDVGNYPITKSFNFGINVGF